MLRPTPEQIAFLLDLFGPYAQPRGMYMEQHLPTVSSVAYNTLYMEIEHHLQEAFHTEERALLCRFAMKENQPYSEEMLEELREDPDATPDDIRAILNAYAVAVGLSTHNAISTYDVLYKFIEWVKALRPRIHENAQCLLEHQAGTSVVLVHDRLVECMN